MNPPGKPKGSCRSAAREGSPAKLLGAPAVNAQGRSPKLLPVRPPSAASLTHPEPVVLPKRTYPAAAISAYILAKDGNRPHLMPEAFTDGAVLTMDVRTDTIQFPQATIGREAIADVLVRRFNQAYENIYTFCVGAPPLAPVPQFEGGWLVVMSEKATGRLRAGCGRYAWTFDGETGLVSELVITIHGMLVLPPDLVPVATAWARTLPYPWCPLELADATMPVLPDLQPLRELLLRSGGLQPVT